MTKQDLLTLYNLSKNIDGLENVYDFISGVYEIAYGDHAINKNYSSEEVLQRIQDFSDDALTYETYHKLSKKNTM
jgi:iron uptake system EfeUOB component EfeO/EfeM